MRTSIPGLALAAMLALAACGQQPDEPSGLRGDVDRLGEIVVYVTWDGQGLPNKQVAILETGELGTTDKQGLVHFALPAGEYTVRAYDINRGGPCCSSVDERVTVRSKESTRLEIVDCLPCV